MTSYNGKCDKISPTVVIEDEILTSQREKLIEKLKVFECFATQNFYRKYSGIYETDIKWDNC